MLLATPKNTLIRALTHHHGYKSAGNDARNVSASVTKIIDNLSGNNAWRELLYFFSFFIIDYNCFFFQRSELSPASSLALQHCASKKIDKQDDKKAINTRLNWPEARLVGTSTFGRSTFRLSYRKKEARFHGRSVFSSRKEKTKSLFSPNQASLSPQLTCRLKTFFSKTAPPIGFGFSFELLSVARRKGNTLSKQRMIRRY